jgi:cystathionine beta-lyase/cystathionine gamma-synthase
VLASVESGGVAAAAFASGLAASDILLRALPRGAKVLAMDDVYGGTRRLLTRVLGDVAGGHLLVTYCDLSDLKIALSALRQLKPDLVW